MTANLHKILTANLHKKNLHKKLLSLKNIIPNMDIDCKTCNNTYPLSFIYSFTFLTSWTANNCDLQLKMKLDKKTPIM